MAIHVFGSVAYDRIMTFPGQFEDHILPEKLHILNVSFLIDRIEEKRGGTGGNIAYNLALMGETPLLYANVGKDFEHYGRAFTALNIPLDNIRRLEENFTACAYITTDMKGNQITGFSPSAMKTPCDPAFFPKPKHGDWGVIAPGNTEDMSLLPGVFWHSETPYIFDPGQQIPVLTPEVLINGIRNAEALIGNDYEIELICHKTGLTKSEMLKLATHIITTFGETGSEIMRDGWAKPRHIHAVQVDHVADPTGAGDAYRAGLLKGLHSGLDIETSAQLGAVCASFCIEKYGTQEHTFTGETFALRYETTFGPFPSGLLS